MWPFSRRRYDQAAQEVGPDAICEAFKEYEGVQWWPLDKMYLLLPERDGRDFGFKYWTDFGLGYRKEVWDCDEIAIRTLADWMSGARKEGFEKQPAMGAVLLRCFGSSIWHIQGFGVFQERKLRFEPQTGEWDDFGGVERVGMLIR